MKYWDTNKKQIRAGMTVLFSFGIPPINVRAKIIKRGGKLIALTPGHNPPECPVHSLKRHVGYLYIRKDLTK